MNISLMSLADIPEIEPGAELGDILAGPLGAVLPRLTQHDIVVVAQKIVSKAEGRYVDLCTIVPSPRAIELATLTHKDPRLVEVILGESTRVVRAVRDVLIVRHRLGFVMAQAGVDQSNIIDGANGERALLLPLDPQRSAQALREQLAARCGVAPGVIISDSFGRPWRLGVVNVAIGAAGISALWDRRGDPDRFGRPLRSTWVAWGDAVASAAGLAMGEAGEGTPVVLVRGAYAAAPHCDARALIRPAAQDLFP